MANKFCIEKHICTECGENFRLVEIKNPEDISESDLQEFPNQGILVIKKGQKIICPGCKRVFS